MYRQPFPESKAKHAKELLGIVHIDLCGPMNVSSIGGSHYFISFIDDFSQVTFIYFLKHKSEFLEKFKNFEMYVEWQIDNSIKVLHSDNGREYINCMNITWKSMNKYLEPNNIRHQKSILHTPEKIGITK